MVPIIDQTKKPLNVHPTPPMPHSKSKPHQKDPPSNVDLDPNLPSKSRPQQEGPPTLIQPNPAQAPEFPLLCLIPLIPSL